MSNGRVSVTASAPPKMQKIFSLVEGWLQWMGRKTSLSYRAANIVVYSILIPFSYAWMLDVILHTRTLRISFVIATSLAFLRMKNFESFSEKLFDQSVRFLFFFRRFGLSYVAASVIICVFLPLLIYIALILPILLSKPPMEAIFP